MRDRRSNALRVVTALLALSLGGCFFSKTIKEPMPLMSLAAAQPSGQAPLVVVLPGAGDNLAGLRASGIVEAVQQGLPTADILLVGATIPYYREGRFVQRLQEEVIEPSRHRGYRRIFLLGASLGGMGTVLYEHEHPGELSGLILLAPFMGDDKLVAEVQDAGGVVEWDAGPLPDTLDADNYQRELWRTVKGWGAQQELAQRVWLACGSEDSLLPASRMIARVLPPAHFLQPGGGHKWLVWNPAATELLKRAALGNPDR